MKSWKERIVFGVICSAMLLAGTLFDAVKFANTNAGWVSENFWWMFKIGLVLAVLGVLYKLFSKDDD